MFTTHICIGVYDNKIFDSKEKSKVFNAAVACSYTVEDICLCNDYINAKIRIKHAIP